MYFCIYKKINRNKKNEKKKQEKIINENNENVENEAQISKTRYANWIMNKQTF